ncbi:MAG TPA: high-potential iron-sulfur protein [Candidatus Sulfotelmatobacter sp.]|nr:high-potential iron-sulfur protein [Candidatus Sulfotelmatobacter sp.]
MTRPMVTGRRALLRAVALGATAGLARAAAAQTTAPAKLTKAEADYQDSPKDIRMCATCQLFEPPNACKVVAGAVSPNGWCKLFAMAD